jgi:hypothetical protein
MVISERVDDMSVDEILPGIKPPQPLDRCAIRIGQARMGWYGPFPDRIGHAVAALLPAKTAADGPLTGRPRINDEHVCALSARRGARHCRAVFKTHPSTRLTSMDAISGEDLGTHSARPSFR